MTPNRMCTSGTDVGGKGPITLDAATSFLRYSSTISGWTGDFSLLMSELIRTRSGNLAQIESEPARGSGGRRVGTTMTDRGGCNDLTSFHWYWVTTLAVPAIYLARQPPRTDGAPFVAQVSLFCLVKVLPVYHRGRGVCACLFQTAVVNQLIPPLIDHYIIAIFGDKSMKQSYSN